MGENPSSSDSETLVKANKNRLLFNLKNKIPSVKKKYIPLLFIIVSFPLIVGIALVQQELRSRASEGDDQNVYSEFQVSGKNAQRWIHPNLRSQFQNQGKIEDPYKYWDTLFDNEDEWSSILRNIDVFSFCMAAVQQNEGDFITRMVPLLKKYNVSIAIEGGALGQTKNADHGCLPNDGEIIAKREIEKIQKIYDVGGKVNYYSMDGPIRRTIGGYFKDNCGWTLDQSVANLILYMKTFHAVHPETKFGIIVNFPNWPYKGTVSYAGKKEPEVIEYDRVLDEIVEQLNASGEKIYYVHADNPYDYAIEDVWTNKEVKEKKIDWVKRILDLEKQVKKHDLKFGLIYNSMRGGNTSDQLFANDTKKYVKLYAERGGKVDDAIIESWFSYPKNITPKEKPHSFLNLVSKIFPERSPKPSTPPGGGANLPFGFHDSATCEAFSGWTCDEDNNYRNSVNVEFYADSPAGEGTLIGSTVADLPRESAVGAECGGITNHGFKFTTPESVKSGENRPIYAYAVDETGKKVSLNKSPKAVNCQGNGKPAPTEPKNCLPKVTFLDTKKSGKKNTAVTYRIKINNSDKNCIDRNIEFLLEKPTTRWDSSPDVVKVKKGEIKTVQLEVKSGRYATPGPKKLNLTVKGVYKPHRVFSAQTLIYEVVQ